MIVTYVVLTFCSSFAYSSTDKRGGFSLNPSCWFSECNEPKNNDFNPYCWFTSCPEPKEENSFWLPDPNQLIEWGKDKFDSIKCQFKECKPEENKVEVLSFFDKANRFLNAAKPQEPVITTFFKSELSPYCWLSECCNRDSIPSNVEKLKHLMHMELYGQHLTEIVIDAISAHWNLNIKPAKPLVLSFHGSVGVGKNYLASLIAKSLFKLEQKSKYVHHFTGRVHFTLEKDTHLNKQNLYNWLKSNVSQCPKQLFIFDEIEKMPSGVLNDMKPFLDYRDMVDGVDYRETIFIFISNIGATEIGQKYEDMIKSGGNREDIKQADFEKLIAKGAFQHEGGFHNTDLVKYNLIDHYIPFLPLEDQHVKKCIEHAFLLRGIDKPLPHHINILLDQLSWNDINNLKIAVNGCKNIASKISLMVAKFYQAVKKTEL